MIIKRLVLRKISKNKNIVNFPFLDDDVSLVPSYGVYISKLVRYGLIYMNMNISCISKIMMMI